MENTQLDLFNNAVTDKAIEKAGKNANSAWISAALDSVHYICLNHTTFTSDDVEEHLERNHADIVTHEKRALGAVMREASKRGWCEHTMTFRPSRRTVCHRNPKAVWRSSIVGATI